MKMKRRGFLRTALAGTAAALPVPGGAASDGSGRPPKIVLIMADDLGYEAFGCYGGKDCRTPNLDELALEGVRFKHCYSQPLCTPSRVEIMTGRYNHRNYEGFGYLNPEEVTFANLLKKRGYSTCIAGKWQLSGDADTVRNFGFDEHCLWNMYKYSEGARHSGPAPDSAPDANPPEGWLRRYDAPVLYENGEWKKYGKDAYGPDVVSDFICSFISEHKEEPFLVYYPMILPHKPFGPTPDSKSSRKRNFADMVEYVDKLVGKIVVRLRKEGVREETLILFTGDNGTAGSIVSHTAEGRVRGGKGEMTDAGTRVPLIANWKGTAPPGRVLDDLVDFSDFLPTLCQAGACPLPEDRIIDGRSFLPQIEGREGDPRDWVFCHYWRRGRNKKGRREFIRNQRWKLYGDGQIFDLENDPMEKNPLKQPGQESVAARKRLETAFEEVKGTGRKR